MAGHSSLVFETVFTQVCDTYGDTVDDTALVAPEGSVSGLFEENDNWNLFDSDVK